MHLYLPLAETSVNIFLILGIGGGIGVLSGLFGVGGGFLLTPLLIMIGIPATVAVGTGANQIVASSLSGVISHWRRGKVDFLMGAFLIGGGIAGSIVGVQLFTLLRMIGQVDLAVGLAYVVLLGSLGGLMLVESTRTIFSRRGGRKPMKRLHQHYALHRLPFKVRFRKSRLFISALLPVGLGFATGIMTAIMGVGGGFVMIPAMIYLIGMPTAVVIGTSLLQIGFVSAEVTILQAVNNHGIDIVLALLLIIGGVIGAQIGVRLGAKLPGERMRLLLALIVIAVCIRVLYGLAVAPDDVFSTT